MHFSSAAWYPSRNEQHKLCQCHRRKHPLSPHCSPLQAQGCPHSSTSLPGSVPPSHTRRKQKDASWRGPITRQEALTQLKQAQRYLRHHICSCNSRVCCTIFSSKAHGFSLDSSDLPPKNKLPVSVGTMGEAGPDPAFLSPVSGSTTAPPFQERDLHGQKHHFIFYILPH